MGRSRLFKIPLGSHVVFLISNPTLGGGIVYACVYLVQSAHHWSSGYAILQSQFSVAEACMRTKCILLLLFLQGVQMIPPVGQTAEAPLCCIFSQVLVQQGPS